jgi:hypothetical protein
MDRIALARQALFEHDLLEHLKTALRLALSWRVDDVGYERKRSTVCFTAESLGRHLERLMEIEEEGGYMREVLDRKPHLAEEVAALRADHELFRASLAELMPKAQAGARLEPAGLDQLGRQLADLLDRIDKHDHKEVDLFQEGLSADEGSGD